MTYPKWVVNGIYLWCIPNLIIFSGLAIVSLSEGYYLASALYTFLSSIATYLLIVIPPDKRPDVIERYVYRDTVRFTRTRIAEHYELLPRGQYVYLLQDVDVTGFCKIGYSNEPSRRLSEFDVRLPMTVKVLHIIPCNNMAQLERALHRQYKTKRVNGEWFDLDENDVAFIQSIGGDAIESD